MLFNSIEFIFLFLPVTVLFYFVTNRLFYSWRAISWLAASLFFYAWWNPSYLSLLILSILFNYYIFYEYKNNLVNTINSPKLVIISGSSGRIGISCKLIQEKIGVSCFNGGTIADMSTNYMLSVARKWLNPGDTALIAIEYLFYHNSDRPNDKVIDYVMAHDPEYLLSLDLKTKIQFLSSISLERLKEGIFAKLNPPQNMKITDFPAIHNQYGDNIDNREAHMTQKLLKQREELGPLKGIEDWKYIEPNQDSMQSINKFVSWCNQNNIQVLATWPNTTYYDIYQKSPKPDFFKSIVDFYQSINVPVIGNYRDFMYDKDLMYDSNYHLNDRGVKIRTSQLIKTYF